MRPLALYAIFPFALISLAVACSGASSTGAAAGLADDTTPDTPDTADGGTSTEDEDSGSLPDGGSSEPSNEDDGTCEIIAPDAEQGVFVATTGTDSGTCGAPASPCRSINAGIARAVAATKSNVYVARGTYTEKVSLKAGVKITGGWKIEAGGWTRVCKSPANAVVVRGPATESITVEARDIGGEATVGFLRLESKEAAQVKPGESLYGLLASGTTTTVRFDQVSIVTRAGGAGADGSDGADGENPPATCAVGSGEAGRVGANGTSPAPTFGPDGYNPGEVTSGTSGTNGASSVAGAAGECLPCGVCNGVCLFEKRGGKTCGEDGGRGCGGGGGTGGAAGLGGGSSIGVYVWDSHVSLSEGSVSAGKGGDGGKGGAGGTGKPGTIGAHGDASATTCLTSCKGLVVSCQENKSAGKGGAGAAGGAGGNGGAGGSGAGGSSYAIYQGGNGLVNVTGTKLENGAAGTGGKGSVPAVDGAAAPRFP